MSNVMKDVAGVGDKPKRRLVALSGDIQAMAKIDEIMVALPDVAQQGTVAMWFMMKYSRQLVDAAKSLGQMMDAKL